MKAKVLSGIDRLDVLDKLLAGRRVGLVVGGSSIGGRHSVPPLSCDGAVQH